MSQDSDGGIEIRIDGDHSTATVIISADTEPSHVVATLIAGLARDREVVIDKVVQGRLEEVVKAFHDDPRDLEEVIARCRPAANGTDGRLVWEGGYDPDAAQEPTAPADDSGAIDQYSRVTYLRVPGGTHVATLHPPTGGEDGCDVLGKVLRAVPGKAAKVTVADSLSVDAEGRLVTQIEGILVFNRGEIAVSRLLEVSGCVDFNTGHIDFDGSVVIKEGIRDRFKVKATENITVNGLIQAAEIDCGGDLHCREGMAARGRGTFRVGGDAYFTYVDGVDGRVEGSMSVEREIRRSILVINGDLRSPRGAIIGGEVTVAGSIRVATLGSQAETPTLVILGEAPSRDATLKKFRVEISQLEGQIKEKRAREKALRAATVELSADEQDEVTLISSECSELQQKIDELGRRHDEMKLSRASSTNMNVEITTRIHARVSLKIGDDTFRFHQSLEGPLTIGWSATRELQYQQGSSGEVHLLTEVAKLLPREAA